MAVDLQITKEAVATNKRVRKNDEVGGINNCNASIETVAGPSKITGAGPEYSTIDIKGK